MRDRETTQTLASLLRFAELADAPADFVADLWTLRAAAPEDRARRLMDIQAQLHAVHADAVATEAPVTLAPVVPLFGRSA